MEETDVWLKWVKHKDGFRQRKKNKTKMKHNNIEIWADVPEYEGLYKVSNDGRIKNCDGSMRRLTTNVKSGYVQIVLLDKKGGRKPKNLYIHRLVGICFVPNPDNKPELHHLNHDKTDNTSLNLLWVTKTEHHKIAHDGKRMIYTQEETKEPKNLNERDEKHAIVRFLYLYGMAPHELSKIYGVAHGTIKKILKSESALLLQTRFGGYQQRFYTDRNLINIFNSVYIMLNLYIKYINDTAISAEKFIDNKYIRSVDRFVYTKATQTNRENLELKSQNKALKHEIERLLAELNIIRVDNTPDVHLNIEIIKEQEEKRLFSTWKAIKQKCYNPNNPSYKLYGAMGVVMCERWKNFYNFLEDVGLQKKYTTLILLDKKGNYEPENCRWAERGIARYWTEKGGHIIQTGLKLDDRNLNEQ